LASQQHQHEVGNLQHEDGITKTSTRSWKSSARGWHHNNISMKLEIFNTRLTSQKHQPHFWHLRSSRLSVDYVGMDSLAQRAIELKVLHSFCKFGAQMGKVIISAKLTGKLHLTFFSFSLSNITTRLLIIIIVLGFITIFPTLTVIAPFLLIPSWLLVTLRVGRRLQ
jgi:hypothetical protein